MNKNNGFSLLEITVVLVIIGAVISLLGPKMFDKRSETRKVFRDFIIAGKDLKSKAKLNGVTYRLAFELGDKGQSWWVERGSKNSILKKASEEDSSDEENKPTSDFSPDTQIFKNKQTLPNGYKFKQVESGNLETVTTEGMAYIHFFPQGLIETSALQIQDPKSNVWTLIYNPLTGHVDIISEAKELKDLGR